MLNSKTMKKMVKMATMSHLTRCNKHTSDSILYVQQQGNLHQDLHQLSTEHASKSYQQALFSRKSSWFSKFFEPMHALLGLKISPATLNSLSQVAEAGSAVLSLSDSWHTAGKGFSTSTVSPGHPRYASNCWVVSRWSVFFKEEKKSSSSDDWEPSLM